MYWIRSYYSLVGIVLFLTYFYSVEGARRRVDISSQELVVSTFSSHMTAMYKGEVHAIIDGHIEVKASQLEAVIDISGKRKKVMKASFSGNVDVSHPQLHATSQTALLSFETNTCFLEGEVECCSKNNSSFSFTTSCDKAYADITKGTITVMGNKGKQVRTSLRL